MSDKSTAVSPWSSQWPKPERVLACVLCQQRKVKCDRSFPCANCTKAQAQCVPGTVARQPRKRRFPERQLLERLRRYEVLLRSNGIEFEPLHPNITTQEKPSTLEGIEDGQHDKTLASEIPSPSSTANSEQVPALDYWHAMNKGFRDPDGSSNSSNDDMRSHWVKNAWNELYEDNDHLLFVSRKDTVDLSTLHPNTVQIFRLWQIYVENVDPLLKVTHTPSLQSRIIEAASNLNDVSPHLEALMFSIYCIATLSLESVDCGSTFGSTKEELLTKFQFGCQQSLLNAGFLRTNHLEVLTALYLYLVSVRPSTDPRSLSSILGISIRIAERMSLHDESHNTKCTPFDAEMRRRLWWNLCSFDSRICEITGNRTLTPTLSPIWDCRVPLNANDGELRLDMKEQPKIQGKCGDAIFTVIRSEIGDFIRYTRFHLDFANPALARLAKDRPNTAGEILVLEEMIESKYLQFCDPENPLHFMTIWTAKAFTARYRLIEHYANMFKRGPPTSALLDTGNSLALKLMESDTMIMTSPLTKGYLWFTQFYYPLPAYLQLVQDLKRRPTSEYSERAWEALDDNCMARNVFKDDKDSPFFRMLAAMILEAWDAREEMFNEQRQPITPLAFITSIRTRLTKPVSISEYHNGRIEAEVSMEDNSTMLIPSTFLTDVGSVYDARFGFGTGHSDPSAHASMNLNSLSYFGPSGLNWDL